MVFKSDIDSVCFVIRSDDAARISQFGNVGKLFNLAPTLAPVFGYLQQSVICADIDQAVFLWRFRQCGGISKESRRSIFGHRVDAPNLSHHGELVAIQTTRELPADHLPTVAPIV